MRALVLFATLLGLATTLGAQGRHPNARQGFWVGFGFGSGSVGLDCTSCNTDRVSAPSGYIRAGGTLSPKLLLGGESNGWVHHEGDVDESVGYGSFIVMLYPSRTGAFYLKFGFGGMKYHGQQGTGPGSTLDASAPAGSFGLGYEFRLGRNFSMVPYLNSLASSAVTLKQDGVPVSTGEDIKITLVQFGLGVTWH